MPWFPCGGVAPIFLNFLSGVTPETLWPPAKGPHYQQNRKRTGPSGHLDKATQRKPSAHRHWIPVLPSSPQHNYSYDPAVRPTSISPAHSVPYDSLQPLPKRFLRRAWSIASSFYFQYLLVSLRSSSSCLLLLRRLAIPANTSSFFTRSVQLFPSSPLQHRILKLSLYRSVPKL